MKTQTAVSAAISAAIECITSLATELSTTVPLALSAPWATPRLSIEYASGLFDGEACIHLTRQRYGGKRKETFRLSVSISQNHLETLEHFRAAVGIEGRLYKVRRKQQHNKQVYTLNYDCKKAMALLALLMPYLVRKRAEAQAALTYWIEGKVGKRWGPKGMPADIAAFRERMYWKMRSLK